MLRPNSSDRRSQTVGPRHNNSFDEWRWLEDDGVGGDEADFGEAHCPLHSGMPGSRLRSGSPASHPSPPLSETNSGSTADCSDGQSLGARLRRGAHIASNNAMLRRMYSLGGGIHSNNTRASGSGGVNNHRQLQQQQQQQNSAASDSNSLVVTGNNHSSTTAFVGASPGSESVGSMETGGPVTGGSKWGDMPFYSLFARSAGPDGRTQTLTGNGASATLVQTAAAGTGGAAATTVGSNVRNGAVDHKEERTSGGKPSTTGAETSSAGSKRPNSMRRSESLPSQSATAITGLKRRGPNNFWGRNAGMQAGYVELTSGDRAAHASSAPPPEEPPPPPHPPLSGSAKAARIAKRKQLQKNQQQHHEEREGEDGVGPGAGSITLESVQALSCGGGLESGGSVMGTVTPSSKGLGLGRSRTNGQDEVEVLRRKVQALGRANKRLTKKVSRRDRTVSDLKIKVQHYRERLAVYEAPLPEDAVGDRRARAREWQRSSARSRSRGGGMNDSEFDGSESGRSRSPRFSRAETGSTAISTPGSMQSQQSRGFTPAPSLSTSTSGGKSTSGEGATIAAVTAAAAAALAIGDGGENRLPPRLGRIHLGSSALPPATPGSSGDTVIGAYAALSTPRAGGGACGDSGGKGNVGSSPGESGPKPDEQATRDTEERAAEAAVRARLAWVYEEALGIPAELGRETLESQNGSRTSHAYGDDPELSPLVLERTCHNDTPPPEQQKQQSTEANGGDADWVGGAGGSDTSKADTSRPCTVAEKPANEDQLQGESGGCREAGPSGIPPELPSVDHKKLFRPNLIVEFSEDSPAFRRKVDALDRNVEGLRGHLQQLVAVARKYCGSGFTFCDHGRELAGILMNLRGESWFTRLGALAPALVSLGEVLEHIQTIEEATLQSLENTFCAPMEDFVKREIKTIRKMKQEMNRASEDHEHAMARFLQLKRNSEESITQSRAAEVALAKKRFEMSRFDLVQHLNQLETRKKHEVVERTCSALYAFLKLFHQCHMLVASTEPHMRELQHALKLSREDLEEEDRMWTEKRGHLENSLNEGIPFSAFSRSGGVPPTPSTGVPNNLITLPSGGTLPTSFASSWGGHGTSSGGNSGGVVGMGGGGMSSTAPPLSAPRNTPESLTKVNPSGAVATAFFLAGPSPHGMSPGMSLGLGHGTGAGTGTAGHGSSSTPLRSAQKRAASLASRFASGVSGAGGGNGDKTGASAAIATARGFHALGGVVGGGGDTGGDTPSSSSLGGGVSSQTNTPATVAGGWGVSKGVSVGMSSAVGVDAESVYCPSPLPSLPTSTGGKSASVWRTGGGWTSDEDEEEDDGEEGGGSGGRVKGRGGRGEANGSGKGDDHGGMSQGLLWSPRQERVIKGGYLWKRSTNVRKDWKRRYFFIQNGKLFYQRQEAYVSPPVRVCDIKLCHVKSCLKDSDLRFSFEIISPKQRTYLLQAEDEESHQSWVSVIKAEIEHLLSASQPSTEGRGEFVASPNGSRQEGDYSADHEFTINKPKYAKLMQANSQCVDCRAKDPEWASISLGVMMCIECSGIHRSMGVHVSKVRSLTLDRWTAPLLELLEKAGNDRANKVWEAYKSDPLFTKISPDCDRSSREAFIRAKYERRRFLDPPFDSSPEATLHASRRLSAAAKEGDVLNALWCLAHGAIVNWANPDENGCTAAQEASRRSHVALLELLVNNGWSLDAHSSEKQEVLSTAAARANNPNASTRDSEMLSLVLAQLPTPPDPRQQPQGGVTSVGDGGKSVPVSVNGLGSRAAALPSASEGAAAAATAAAKVALAFQQKQQRR